MMARSVKYKHNTWFEVVDVDILTGEIMIDDGVSFNGGSFGINSDVELKIVEVAE